MPQIRKSGYSQPNLPDPVNADNRHFPAANTAAIVTKAAVAGQKWVLEVVEWSYSATPTANVGRLTIAFNGIVYKDYRISAAGPGKLTFDRPLEALEVNTALVVTLTAAGASNTGTLMVTPYTR